MHTAQGTGQARNGPSLIKLCTFQHILELIEIPVGTKESKPGCEHVILKGRQEGQIRAEASSIFLAVSPEGFPQD